MQTDIQTIILLLLFKDIETVFLIGIKNLKLFIKCKKQIFSKQNVRLTLEAILKCLFLNLSTFSDYRIPVTLIITNTWTKQG